MRHCFSPICIMLTAILTLSSCLSNDDNDDTTYYDDTAISSFSLGTLSVVNHTTAKDGVTDSTYTTSLTGSNCKFDIDQLSATISNADSLPAGTKVSAVLATIGTVNGGTAVLNLKSSTGKDSLVYYSSSDSIDFSNPVRVRVYNMRATAYREYTVTVNVHREQPDAFAWNKTEVAGLSGVTNRHFVTLTDGTVALLGQRNGVDVAFTHDEKGWKETKVSDADTDALAHTAKYKYAMRKGSIVRSLLGKSDWNVESIDDDATNLPTTDANIIARESEVNPGTYNLVLVGNNDGKTVVWSKVEESDNADNEWAFYPADDYNKKTLPYLANLTATGYDGGIIATGGDFSKVYFSPDYGLTWSQDTTYTLPEDFGSKPAHVTITTDANNIMYITRDDSNEIWSGRLARLGWAKPQTSFSRAAR